jgi:hypothetical protein
MPNFSGAVSEQHRRLSFDTFLIDCTRTNRNSRADPRLFSHTRDSNAEEAGDEARLRLDLALDHDRWPGHADAVRPVVRQQSSPPCNFSPDRRLNN